MEIIAMNIPKLSLLPIQDLSETMSEDSAKHQTQQNNASKNIKTIVNTNNDDMDSECETLNPPLIRCSKHQTTSAQPNYSNTSNVSFEPELTESELESEILENE